MYIQQLFSDTFYLIEHVQTKRRNNLIVAAPAGMKLGGGIPDDLLQPFFDSGVYIFVPLIENKTLCFELKFDLVKALLYAVVLRRIEYTGIQQPLRLRTAALNVVECKP